MSLGEWWPRACLAPTEDWPQQLRMSPRQRMCESGRIKKSSTELRGFSRLTQTPSSFFFLFLSRTSPDFWVRSVVNSHIAQTHEILRVRLCATHKKKTKRLKIIWWSSPRSQFCSQDTITMPYHPIFTPYTVQCDRCTEACIYYVWYPSFPGNSWWILCWPIRATLDQLDPSIILQCLRRKRKEI